MIDESLRVLIQAGSMKFGLGLDSTQVDQLTQYLSHLERWNRTLNLTSLPLENYPVQTLDRLIFEPLRSAPFFGRGPFRWMDFGSGGGSPAIPLRIVLPGASLTMIESRSRKAAFLRDVVRTLGLSDVEVLWERVEVLRQIVPAGSVDVLTVRALRIDEDVLRSVKHVLNITGRLILFGPVDVSRLLKDFRALETKTDAGGVTVLLRSSH
jgi:16S rRNA (guanine527-N7)-methyltransferase